MQIDCTDFKIEEITILKNGQMKITHFSVPDGRNYKWFDIYYLIFDPSNVDISEIEKGMIMPPYEGKSLKTIKDELGSKSGVVKDCNKIVFPLEDKSNGSAVNLSAVLPVNLKSSDKLLLQVINRNKIPINKNNDFVHLSYEFI